MCVESYVSPAVITSPGKVLPEYPITRLPDGVCWPCVWWWLMRLIASPWSIECLCFSVVCVRSSQCFFFGGEPPGSVREERSQVFVNLNPRNSILKCSDSLPHLGSSVDSFAPTSSAKVRKAWSAKDWGCIFLLWLNCLRLALIPNLLSGSYILVLLH